MSYQPTSSARQLAVAYGLLILYASLYPFGEWRWPPGQGLLELARLPWPRWRTDFDMAANFMGYLPLGFLLAVAQLRRRAPLWRAALGATVLAGVFSYLAELTQQFLPGRHPSALDWLLNLAGAAVGSLMACGARALGMLARWQTLRDRWFIREGSLGRTLLALWPLALLSPAPVALGLGHVGPILNEGLQWLLADWPAAEPWLLELQAAQLSPAPTSPWSDGLIQLLGLLAPCLVAFAITLPGWRRGAMALGALATGFAATTLAAALSFGPEHALAWMTPATPLAWSLAMLLAALLSRLNLRMVAACGLVVITAQVALLAQAPSDPYFAQNLQAWEQGRFVHFHGLALWLGWLWPFAAIAWLVRRLARAR